MNVGRTSAFVAVAVVVVALAGCTSAESTAPDSPAGRATATPTASPSPQPMTIDEAGQLYLRLVTPVNDLAREWDQLGEVTNSNLASAKALASRHAEAVHTFAAALREHVWPLVAQAHVQALVAELESDLTMLRKASTAASVEELSTVLGSWTASVAAPLVREDLHINEVPA